MKYPEARIKTGISEKLLIVLMSLFLLFHLSAQNSKLVVTTSINLIDGTIAPYNTVQPGDTIFLEAGIRNKLLIRNFTGSVQKPITFINKAGIVNISTDDYYGISISNCRYFRFSGMGTSTDYYGIQITKVLVGAGMGISSMSSDIEIDHILIKNCLTAGIYAKTDPTCTNNVSRETFTQFNTIIHDNYISNVGNEGMYIGSSFYSGMTINCNGKDSIVMPPILDGVKIYNNIVKSTGWDGIQVSSASKNCQIYNDSIINDSQAEVSSQMSGIIMGGGSKCDCFNNFISDGKGDGIENHGLGGTNIYNNIIVNAGISYYPNDPTKMKHGIFISDVSVMKDSSFNIIFNNIINAKTDGIRFQSINSKNNLIASNLIFHSGTYNIPSLNDNYVVIPNALSDVLLKNNFFTKNIQDAGISLTDYTILPGSPLIKKAYFNNMGVQFDFKYTPRPTGVISDIGAIMHDAGIDTLSSLSNESALLFPNPAINLLTIRCLSLTTGMIEFLVYNLTGELVLQQARQIYTPGVQEFQVTVDKLASGVFIYSIQNGKQISNGKFIKFK
ncbi:MAG: T9SS type A sorting domain-containing protein [Bacteroidota bacterium]